MTVIGDDDTCCDALTLTLTLTPHRGSRCWLTVTLYIYIIGIPSSWFAAFAACIINVFKAAVETRGILAPWACSKGWPWTR
jgi:hypothetical protein